MGLTNQEKINFNSKVLAANVQDGTPSKQWYESIRPNFFILEDNQVLTEFDTVRANPAANLATARSNCTGALSGIVVDLSQPASAVRLTEDIAANGFQYIALSIYNDFSSSRLDKWIQPQKVPQTNGQPSIGYSIQLYDGDPNSGGTLINTSDGQTGAGNTASPGWIFNYDTGTLLLSEDFKSTISDPYIVGFRYIGETVEDGTGGSCDCDDHPHERIYFETTQSSHTYGTGSMLVPVYHTISGWVPAIADSIDTLALAFITSGVDANNIEITLAGRANVPSHGLTEFEYYFLDETTPGGMTKVFPIGDKISQPLLWVEDQDHVLLWKERPVIESDEVELPLHALTHQDGGTDELAHDTLAGRGSYTHSGIDLHINDNSLHFTEGSVDHNALTNLTVGDAHTQYQTEARADTWLATKSIQDLNDVDETDTPAKNDIVIFNGTKFVFAPEGTTFTFSIASFSDNDGVGYQEIGTGTWKAIGAITFSATYNNGPATNGEIYLAEWGAGNKLTLTGGSYEGPTANTIAVTYPSVGGARQFQLQATDSVDNDTSNRTYYFWNWRYWGVTSKTSSYTETDIEGLSGSELSNTRVKTFTVSPAAGEYILYCYPTRLGTATFTVGGFSGGFESPETVSVTNSKGYTEDYYAYRSSNSGLGSTTVEVT